MAFEQVKTHLCPNNAGPLAFGYDVRRDNYDGPLMLEAWISNFGGSNVHLCRGRKSLADAQSLLESGLSDLLCTVTGSGPSRIQLPDDVREITVFFEGSNTSGQYQAVTTRIYAK